MKNLIVCSYFLPVPDVSGGAVENLVTQVIDYNEKYYKNDYTVVTVKTNKVDYSKYKYTKFIFLNNTLLNLLTKIIPIRILLKLYSKMIFKKANLKEYDKIIIENEFVIGIEIFKKYNIKPILHLHNSYFDKSNGDILNSFSKVICISEYIKKTVTCSNKNVETIVIENGIDGKYTRKFFPTDTIFKFVFAGRIVPEKGVLEMVKAFKKAFNEQNVKLIILGGKGKGQTKYYKNVISEIQNNSNIDYLGFVNRDKMIEIYNECNCGIIPSTWNEPFGLALVEQMSMQMPIICSKYGAFSEILGTEYELFIDPTNINEFSKTLRDVVTGRYNLDYIAKANYQKSKKFTSENYCKKFQEFIMKG